MRHLSLEWLITNQFAINSVLIVINMQMLLVQVITNLTPNQKRLLIYVSLLIHIRSVYVKCNMLKIEFNNCYTDVKRFLFHYCITFYCSQLWGSFTQKRFNK